MNLKLLLFTIFLISACSPASPAQPSVVTPIISATPEPSFTPAPTPDLAYRKILSATPSETAKGAEYFFDESMTPQEQTAVKKSVDLAYSYVSEYVNGETIPAEIYVMKDCTKLDVEFVEYLKRTGEMSGIGATACARPFAQLKAIFIFVDPVVSQEKPDELAGIVIHEYFHIVQNFLSKNNQTIENLIAPPWMLEGSADYFKLLILRDIKSAVAEESWEWREHYLRTNTKTIAEIGNKYDAGEAYSLGSLAVRYLLDTYGYDKLFELYIEIGSGNNWEDSFEKVFDLSTDTFSADFESYRNTDFAYVTVTPTIPVGTGVVLGKLLTETGYPLKNVLVYICNENPICPSTRTDENGSFSFTLPAGSYGFGFMIDGEHWSGYYYAKGNNNYSANQNIMTTFRLDEGSVVGVIEILVPINALIDLPEFPCGYPLPADDGKQYFIEGNIVDTSGQLLPGYSITACPKLSNCYGDDFTNGKFKIRIPNGIYFLGVNELIRENNTPPVGWYGGEGVITPTQSCAGAIYVNGANVSDIIITYP